MTIILIVSIILFPDSIIRIILSIPFLLFFPGYALISTLFPGERGPGRMERIALSFGLSIVVVALIGFGLNYTAWGLEINSVLYSISAFILVLSSIAMVRHARISRKIEFTQGYTFRIQGWNGRDYNKSLTVILAICVVGVVGVLSYITVIPKNGEQFTEFYILGLNGKAEDYPNQFLMVQGNVIEVRYGTTPITMTNTPIGKVTLGIVNHEQQEMTYSVVIKIDDRQVSVNLSGSHLEKLDGIVLQPGQTWLKELGFTPWHTGDNQKVEFLLYKNGILASDNSLHIWIDVENAQ
ncbi:MAG: DUF1616 domain-containing protein [Dehalococcoidales bacterium]|nr:DUF1616 domain-containing protein [Dehalococcoidales bacterium]